MPLRQLTMLKYVNLESGKLQNFFNQFCCHTFET